MAETGKRNFAPQFVGLGGTGSDVIASFMRNRELVESLLETEGLRVSCLALDVAAAQIDGLEKAYAELQAHLKGKGISADKVFLSAKSVKFPTPETMFSFVGNYQEYLKREDSVVPDKYEPWLGNATEVPPLAGGVGRKRALAKGIYGLNYHLLNVITPSITAFKNRVAGSTVQPIVFVVYGLGGGSGSGMALDFVCHLRKELGAGIPIIGLGILPCPGDDPPAKGTSAYTAIHEHAMLLDKSTNERMVLKYGKRYANPFNGFFVLPLGPAYSQGKGLVYAHETLDRSIVEIIVKCLNFDPADLLGNIGGGVDLGGRWLHAISSISITYPVQEHIGLTESYLELLEALRDLRKDKMEIVGGSDAGVSGGVRRLLDFCMSEATDVFRYCLIQKGAFNPDKFKEMVQNRIHEDRKFDTDYAMQLRGSHESINHEAEELLRSVRTVGQDAPAGTLEAKIHDLLKKFEELVKDLPARPGEFEGQVDDMVTSLREDILTANLPHLQVALVEDVIKMATMIKDYLGVLRAYLECRRLVEQLPGLLNQLPQTDEREKNRTRINRIANPELTVLFPIVSLLYSTLKTELRRVDGYHDSCRKAREPLAKDEERIGKEIQVIETRQRRAKEEHDRVSNERRKVTIFAAPGKRRRLDAELETTKGDLERIGVDLSRQKAEAERVAGKLKEYAALEKKFEINSAYRRHVARAVDLKDKYAERESEVNRDRGFYDRSGELTQNERGRIMQRVLRGDERALSRETVLREIIDQDHLRQYLQALINLFKLPGTLGLTGDYKSDFLWFTVIAPPGIWCEELEQAVTTALAGYVTQDVARSIYIRQIQSDDPWKVRFLLVAAKARPEWLSVYQDMQQIYQAATPGERHMAHSFMLEHGIHAGDLGASKPSPKLEPEQQSRMPVVDMQKLAGDGNARR
jgi:hypothetical protein